MGKECCDIGELETAMWAEKKEPNRSERQEKAKEASRRKGAVNEVKEKEGRGKGFGAPLRVERLRYAQLHFLVITDK